MYRHRRHRTINDSIPRTLFNLSVPTHDTCDRQITNGSYISVVYISSSPPISVTEALLRAPGIPITRARSRNVNGSREIESSLRSSLGNAAFSQVRKVEEDENAAGGRARTRKTGMAREAHTEDEHRNSHRNQRAYSYKPSCFPCPFPPTLTTHPQYPFIAPAWTRTRRRSLTAIRISFPEFIFITNKLFSPGFRRDT